MRKALNLVGDGDELELIRDTEEIFAIKFQDAELEACRTAGDLHGIVWRHLSGNAGAGNVRCMNAMSFYLLCRTLASQGAGGKIRPSDRLKSFSISPKRLAKALRVQTGLAVRFSGGMLEKAGRWLAKLAVAAMLLAIPARILHSQLLPVHQLLVALAMLLLFAGVILVGSNRGSYKGCDTVGDAAARISEQNYGKLVEKGARLDPAGVWKALCAGLSLYGNCSADEIGPGTLLIHP